MEQTVFIIIYTLIILQLLIGISNNKTNTIFGTCSSEIINKKIDLNNNTLVNYFSSLTVKKITHIIQGCFFGLLLLNNYNILNIFNLFVNNSNIQCNNSLLNIQCDSELCQLLLRYLPELKQHLRMKSINFDDIIIEFTGIDPKSLIPASMKSSMFSV